MSTPATRRASRRAFSDASFVDRLLGVRTWLLALAVVPLLGATGLVYDEFDHIQDSRADAKIVAAAAEDLVALVSLGTALGDESSMSQVDPGTRTIARAVRGGTGGDVQSMKRSVAAVDRHLDELAWQELRSQIEDLRASVSSGTCVSNCYATVSAGVRSRTNEILDNLLQSIGRSDGSDATLQAFRVFEEASLARELLILDLASSSQPVGPGRYRLSANSGYEYAYQNALEQIAQRSPADGNVRAMLAELQLLVHGTDKPNLAAGGPVQAVDGSAAPWPEGPALVRKKHLVAVHDVLVEASASSFTRASKRRAEALSRSATGGLGRIGVLLAASILFAFGLASAVGRPLSSLAKGAQALRDGADAATLKPSGPTEVRQAMLAINEAAAHITLAERQARVLADGQLSDPVLGQNAPGALGQSLQATVRTLASSLNEREEFRRRLSHEATHDGLTQLANRKASLHQLEKSVARTVRSGSTLAVMFIDLDGFKAVNDDHGHPVGDALLWTLGKRLTTAVRAGDHVGRIGGDEFLVIAEPVAGAAEARQLAARIAAQVSEPMSFENCEIAITASIGLAITDVSKRLTASELLYDADLAVYRAKELGRNRIELCDDSLHQELLERSTIEDALRQAISRDELSMHYQPILDARTAQLSSLEALIRWDRIGHGMTPPDQFIPIAERSNLIREVDNWVISHVVGQLRRWSSDPVLRNVPIAINISGRHLSAETFVDDIISPIKRAGIDPRRLIVEVTESALVEDLEVAATKLQRLRDESIRVAIDDFGTGYTSLGHLRRLPIDILKIDRSFINDPSASSLVKLIIDTGHLIGVTVTSEGIETVDQAAQFTELGTDSLQGYLFARPMPADHVEQELRHSTANDPPFLTRLVH